MNLGTVQGFAERRGVDYDPTDLKAIRALDDASAFIRNYTNQEITFVEEDTATLNGNGRYALVLPEVPVVEISTVTVTDWNGDATELEPTDYVMNHGILYRVAGGPWPRGRANVVVVYDHGYGTVPLDIASVCYSLAAENYIATGGGVKTSESIGPENYAYTSDPSTVSTLQISAEHRLVLGRYRKVVFG